MGNQMQDKRRYKRFSVDILGINGKMMFANDVEIHDISVGGISLRVDRRLNIGNEYTLKIGDSKNKTISLKGSVVWSKISGTKKGLKDEIIPIYSAGMKFVTMSAERIKELTTFLEGQENFSREKLHSPSGLRCSMRFLVSPPLKKAVLDVRESYAVKKLSLGGMLIESESPLEINDRVPMEILLPGDTPIEFLGRTASCLKVPEGDHSRYDIGIEFVEMTEADKRKLHEFVLVLEKTG
jgi:c-di-GMP-binding flagellar brake protein YcgR